MHKIKARWAALFTALLLICSFAFAACDGESEGDLGAIRDIYIVTADLKTTYTVGEVFDYSAVKLRAVYENGDESLTAADADKGVSHTELDMAKSGTQTLTVTYKEKSASVAINVVAEEKAVLKGLQFSGGTTAYTVNDDIDYHSFTLTAIYSVGADRTLYGDSQGVTHNDISTAGEGEKELTFTYTDGGVSKSVTVKIIVSAGPVPVTLISIEVRSTAAARTVEFGAQLDDAFLEQFTIVCHYSDGSTNQTSLKGNSEGVTTNVEDIQTSVAGEKDLTFTYGGKSVTVPITVLEQVQKQNLSRFALPAFYADVAAIKDDGAGTQSQNRDIFMKGFESYKVGDDNAFEFQPYATTIISTAQEVPVTVRTTFTLEIKGDSDVYTSVAADQVETYVTTNPLLPNYYYFTEAAVGKVFKLKIKPDSESYTGAGATTEIEAIIEVVDGYNVYDQIGLSVFDNLNVKHWQAIKEAAGTLRWDDKPLVDYNIIKTGDEKCAPVKNIVLHGDINIDPDQLPDSYFWQEGETIGNSGYASVNSILQGNSKIPASVKNSLEGSLKDGLNENQHYKFDDETSGDLNEDAKTSVNMQKGVYVSTGTGIEGNFHEITYRTSGAKHSLYTVYDGKSKDGSAFPLSHWSLFKYGNETTQGVEIVNEGKPHISDLRILGQSPRKAATEGEPSHLMAFNTCTNTMSLENCIVSRLFVVVLGDEASSGVNVSDSKIFDIYSNMFYLWRAKADVKNCIMEDAGGPVFILCDGDRTKAAASDNEGPQLVTDTASRLKSEAAGTESWYKLNDASVLFTAIQQLNEHAQNDLGISYVSKYGADLVNVVALLVPEPSSIRTAKSDGRILPYGSAQRGEEYYKLNTTNSTTIDQYIANAKTQGAAFLRSGSTAQGCLAAHTDLTAITGINPADGTMKTAWQTAYAAGSEHWLMLVLNAGSILDRNNHAQYPYFGLILGDVSAV